MAWDAERFAKLLDERGITRAELARRIGVSQQGLRSWLPPSGPTGEFIDRLAAELQVERDSLFDDPDERNRREVASGMRFLMDHFDTGTDIIAAAFEVDEETVTDWVDGAAAVPTQHLTYLGRIFDTNLFDKELIRRGEEPVKKAPERTDRELLEEIVRKIGFLDEMVELLASTLVDDEAYSRHQQEMEEADKPVVQARFAAMIRRRELGQAVGLPPDAPEVAELDTEMQMAARDRQVVDDDVRKALVETGLAQRAGLDVDSLSSEEIDQVLGAVSEHAGASERELLADTDPKRREEPPSRSA